uniref:Dorsal inhibitory axon guidance protein n=1 Tax=Rhinolophus ferrumequinum TaxID=59479 RepID=A0A671FDX0_RHIFE
MAGTTTHVAPMLFLALLVLLELSLAGSLGPGTPARNVPENHINLPGPALWTPQASHHPRRGLGKKERGSGMPGRAQEGAVVTSTRQASRLPGAGALLPGKSPAGLLQDKNLLLGLALPYPEKENRSPGSERVKKRGREHKRRRERLKLHRGQGLVRGPSSLRKKVELSEDQVLDAVMEDSSTSLAPTILYLTTFEAAPATKESPILPVTSLWPQAQPRPDGEVMPTLDMALFDWTDYEDLKPDVWPSAKKKGTSSYPTTPALGLPASLHHHLLGQPSLTYRYSKWWGKALSLPENGHPKWKCCYQDGELRAKITSKGRPTLGRDGQALVPRLAGAAQGHCDFGPGGS